MLYMVKNVYKTSDSVKKRLPKGEDAQYQYTGMKINSHFLVCGPTGAGKSVVLFNYLLETSKPRNGTFDKVFVCYKTDEPLYEEMREQLKGNIHFYNDLQSFPSATDFADAIKQQEPEHYLVVFDDCVNDKDRNSEKKVEQYFTFARKKNVTVCYLTQSFYKSPIFIRQQMKYLLLLDIQDERELQMIMRTYGGMKKTPEQIMEMFDDATTPRDADDLPFFKIACFKVPPAQKFSRDFIEYFDA